MPFSIIHETYADEHYPCSRLSPTLFYWSALRAPKPYIRLLRASLQNSSIQSFLLIYTSYVVALQRTMANYKSEELPHVVEMRDRVLAKASGTTGHLEDQTLDLDARTLAMLGKRQQLNVRLVSAMDAALILITPCCRSETSGWSPWLPSPQPCLLLGSPLHGIKIPEPPNHYLTTES